MVQHQALFLTVLISHSSLLFGQWYFLMPLVQSSRQPAAVPGALTASVVRLRT